MSASDEQKRFRNAFGAALDGLLRRKGMNQSELAAKLKSSRSYVSQVINGTKTPSPALADRASDALDLKPDETVELHRAAARSAGYKVDPPKKR